MLQLDQGANESPVSDEGMFKKGDYEGHSAPPAKR